MRRRSTAPAGVPGGRPGASGRWLLDLVTRPGDVPGRAGEETAGVAPARSCSRDGDDGGDDGHDRWGGRRRPRLATVWLGGCSGCHVLDLDERLLDLGPRADVVFSPVADAKAFPEGVDVTLVEGRPTPTTWR